MVEIAFVFPTQALSNASLDGHLICRRRCYSYPFCQKVPKCNRYSRLQLKQHFDIPVVRSTFWATVNLATAVLACHEEKSAISIVP